MEAFVCDNITVNEKNHLCFAGQDVTELAAEYGTPLYLMDEERIRSNMRMYREAMKTLFPAGAMPLYAGKAACFKEIYRIAREEEIGIDVVSSGEIHTAAAAGFDLSRAYFHSNNKTDEDIAYAMESGVGYLVTDNVEELEVIDRIAGEKGCRQKILLRLTPGIDTHTYDAVNTGKVDSKFGTAIETGQAEEITRLALGMEHIVLKGFHCHVGSQVFAEDVFERSAVIMLRFIAQMKEKLGFVTEELDLGGGYGVRYTAADGYVNIPEKLESVAAAVRQTCRELDVAAPKILMEPGRSIVADAGMTLYTVGTVKKIPGYKNYVSVDGGMGDNPRYALYGSKYSCYNAGKMAEPKELRADLVGRYCESGDVIQPDVGFPVSTRRYDVVAVCTTGAYNYSMASNYNRLGRPALVMLREGTSRIAVRRETPEDLTACEL